MPTLVAELDVSKVEQGLARIRQAFDQLEQDARATGQALDQAFERPVSIKGAPDVTSTLTGIRREITGLLTESLGLSSLDVNVSGASQAADQLAQLGTQAGTILTTTEPLKQLTFDGDSSGARDALGQILEDSFQALESTEPLKQLTFDAVDEGAGAALGGIIDGAKEAVAATGPLGAIAVEAVGAAAAGDDIASVADEAVRMTGAATELRTAIAGSTTALSVLGTGATVTVGALAALAAGLTTAAVLNGDLDESLTDLGDSATAFLTELGRLGGGLISFGASISETIGLTSLLNQGLGLISDGIDIATGIVGDFADTLLGVPPSAAELRQELEESNATLAELSRQAAGAGGAAGLLSRAFGETDRATLAYNRELERNQALTAAVAEETRQQAEALRAFSQDLDNQIALFDQLDEAQRNAAFNEFNEQFEATIDLVDQAGRAAFQAFNDDFNDTIDLLNEAGQAAFAAFEDSLEIQIDLFQQVAEARREAFEEDFQRQIELFEQVGQVAEENAALAGVAIAGIAEALGVSEQAVASFGDNVAQILNQLGLTSAETFDQLAGDIARAFGLAREQVDGFFAVANDALDVFGIELEDVFGRRAAAIFEQFAGLSSQTIDLVLAGGQRLLDFFGLTFPASVGTGNQALLGFQAQGGTTLNTVLTAGTGLLDLFGLGLPGAIGQSQNAFGLFGTSSSSILTNLIGQTGLLGNSLGGIGTTALQVGGAIGTLGTAFAGGAALGVQGFQSLQQQLGTTTSVILGVLNPAILVSEGLLNQFGISGADVFNGLRNVAEAAFGAIQNAASTVFNAIQSAAQALGNLLQGIWTTIQNSFQAAFNVIQNVAGTVFNAIQSAGQAMANALQGIVNAIQSAFTAAWNAMQAVGQAVWNAIQSAAQAMAGALQGIFNAIQGAFTAAWNAIQSVGQSVFNALVAAGQAMGNALQGVFQGISNVASSVFSTVTNVAQSAFNGIVSGAKAAASAASSALGGITSAAGSAVSAVGGVVGKVGSAVGSAVKSVGKVFGFAEGGVITGPIALHGAGTAGRAFASGGILDSLTGLNGLAGGGSITPTNKLGIAGEAGPEAILPLARTSQGLGVNAVGAATTSAVVQRQVIFVEGVDRSAIDKLKAQILEVDASVDFRAGLAAEDLLLGLT